LIGGRRRPADRRALSIKIAVVTNRRSPQGLTLPARLGKLIARKIGTRDTRGNAMSDAVADLRQPD
jgi:hypothetical protein